MSNITESYAFCKHFTYFCFTYLKLLAIYLYLCIINTYYKYNKNMKSVTFTNNMSSDLMQWMEKYSTKEKLTRRAVIEKALNEFRKSVRRKEYEIHLELFLLQPYESASLW